jgi:hypothetical protein
MKYRVYKTCNVVKCLNGSWNWKMNIEYHEKHLSNLGIELEKARTRRLDTLTEIQRVSSVAEMTKCNKSISALSPLNRAEEADARLIRSLEGQIKDVKRQLDLARAQAAAIASRAAAAQSSAVEHSRWFEVNAPHGRVVRHRHASLESIRAALSPGYTVKSELFGVGDDGSGGFPVAIGQRKQLLAALHAMSEA